MRPRLSNDWTNLQAPTGMPQAEEDKAAWRRYDDLLAYAFREWPKDFDRAKQAADWWTYEFRRLQNVAEARATNLRRLVLDALKLSNGDATLAMQSAADFVGAADPGEVVPAIQRAISDRRLTYAWTATQYAIMQEKDRGRGSALEAGIMQAGGLGALSVAIGRWSVLQRALRTLDTIVQESETNTRRGGWPTIATSIDNQKHLIPHAITAWSKAG